MQTLRFQIFVPQMPPLQSAAMVSYKSPYSNFVRKTCTIDTLRYSTSKMPWL